MEAARGYYTGPIVCAALIGACGGASPPATSAVAAPRLEGPRNDGPALSATTPEGWLRSIDGQAARLAATVDTEEGLRLWHGFEHGFSALACDPESVDDSLDSWVESSPTLVELSAGRATCGDAGAGRVRCDVTTGLARYRFTLVRRPDGLRAVELLGFPDSSDDGADDADDFDPFTEFVTTIAPGTCARIRALEGARPASLWLYWLEPGGGEPQIGRHEGDDAARALGSVVRRIRARSPSCAARTCAFSIDDQRWAQIGWRDDDSVAWAAVRPVTLEADELETPEPADEGSFAAFVERAEDAEAR